MCKSEITKSIDSTLVDASLRKKLPKKSLSIIVIESRALEVYEKDKMLNLPVRKNQRFFNFSKLLFERSSHLTLIEFALLEVNEIRQNWEPTR